MNGRYSLHASPLRYWTTHPRLNQKSARLLLIAGAHIVVLGLLWQASRLPLNTRLMPVLTVQLLAEPPAPNPAQAQVSHPQVHRQAGSAAQTVAATPPPDSSRSAAATQSAPAPAPVAQALSDQPAVTPSTAPSPVAAAEATSAPHPQTEQPAPRQIPLSAVRYLVPPPAEVPRASRRAGEHGTVWLRVLVSSAGLPMQVTLHRSSGFARLDEQAVWAMRQARFKPAEDAGKPIEVEVMAPIDYPAD